MLRLQSLDIRQFRGLAPGGTLHFSPTMNVLLGQNASGKTTLLELLVAVLKGSFKAYAQEPLDLSYLLLDDETQAVIQVTYRNTVSDNVLTSDLARAAGLVTPASSFDATLSITFTNGTVCEVVTDGRSTTSSRNSQTLRRSESAPDRAGLLFGMFWNLTQFVDDLDSDANVRKLFFRFVSFLRNLRRFDEGLDTFNAITGGTGDPVQLTVHSPASGTRYSVDDFIPRPLESAVLREMAKGAPPKTLFFVHDDLPFLSTVEELLEFKTAGMGLSLAEHRELKDESKLTTYRNFGFSLMQPDSSIVTHDYLSYGQKRLLAFLYYLAANDQVVVADELVNGLHHGWIQSCIQQIGTRQVFLTSQNPLLLDYLTFESPDEVMSRFVTCSRSIEAGKTVHRWANVTEEDAQRFLKAYQMGIQHVGEILRNKGLW